MNAPFQPRGATLRNPFAAFACDDETADMLRAVAVEFGWVPDKVSKGGLRNAVQTLSVSASPQILFVDLAESGDPLGDINALAEVCEPGTVVIAAGQINDVRLYRDLLGSGIQDYLLKPFSPDQLREAFAGAQMIVAGPRGNEPGGADRQHLMATVIGVRGGAGASTIASSLAWMMSEKAARRTALLDLDIHFGTGALSLDVEPGRGLTDAIENPSRIDGLFIERAMIRATERLSILSAEAPINQPILSDGSAFHQLGEELRGAFETTVLDLPRSMLVQYPHLVQDMQVVVLVVEFTLAATRDAIRLLSWLKSNAPQARVVVLANKAQVPALQEVSRKDFENSIERKVDIVVPFDVKAAAQAAKLGQPLAKAAPAGKLAQALASLLSATLATVEDSDVPAAKASGSLFDKLGTVKSMLAKAPKGKVA